MPTADPILSPTSSNPLIRGITWGDRWSSGTAQTQLKIYIASDETVVFEQKDAIALVALEAEREAVAATLSAYEKLLNVHFTMTDSLEDSDIYFAFAAGSDPTLAEVPGTLGIAMAPDRTIANFQGGVLVNRDAYQSGATGLAVGGYDYVTLLHEFGHAMGLAHPHDTGGASTVYPGVTENQSTGDLGDFDLNQAVYTMMSYNDGWQTAPQGPLDSNTVWTRGFTGTPMALDIAALQALYGANATTNIGNNVYNLPTVNQTGSFYGAIWDKGGLDEIANNSGAGSVIDLRPATLQVAQGGGGFISHVAGIDGGFTIANGVLIENATGGSAADTIIGNVGNNVLNGRGGADAMTGGLGNDTFIVDNAGDKVIEFSGGGSDTVSASVSFALASSNWVEILQTTSASGSAGIDLTGNNIAQGIIGNSGANKLGGLGGDDLLFGLGGNDTLTGGTGKDTFQFNTALSSAGNVDAITDFNVVDDTIKLAKSIFAALNVGALSSDAFWKSTAGVAHDTSDRIIYDSDGGALTYDADGALAGGVGAIKFAVVGLNLGLTNADFTIA